MLDNTDWHEVEEERFARQMAQKINQEAESGALPEIVIIAPPRTLGEIRHMNFQLSELKRVSLSWCPSSPSMPTHANR